MSWAPHADGTHREREKEDAHEIRGEGIS